MKAAGTQFVEGAKDGRSWVAKRSVVVVPNSVECVQVRGVKTAADAFSISFQQLSERLSAVVDRLLVACPICSEVGSV